MNDLLAYLKRHPTSQSTKLITNEGVRSSMTCPLFVNNTPFGFLFFSSDEVDTYTDFHVSVLKEISNQLALLLMTSRVVHPVEKAQTVASKEPTSHTSTKLAELIPGMVVGAPVLIGDGRLLIAAGVALTQQSISRLATLESQGFFSIGSVSVRTPMLEVS